MKRSDIHLRKESLFRQLVPVILLLIIGLLSSCAPDFIADNFDKKTLKHSEVAILPFEMVYTGKMPRKLTEEDIAKLSELESEAFMISFYNQVHRTTRRKRRKLKIRLQPHNRTIEKLLANDISIQDSWKMDSEELAKVLEVDAVVRGRIEKNQIMSDYASLGVDVGVSILEEIFFPNRNIGIGGGRTLARNKEVRASYSLIDYDGELLWANSSYSDSDWTRQSDEMVDQLNLRSARRFPYRKGS